MAEISVDDVKLELADWVLTSRLLRRESARMAELLRLAQAENESLKVQASAGAHEEAG